MQAYRLSHAQLSADRTALLNIDLAPEARAFGTLMINTSELQTLGPVATVGIASHSCAVKEFRRYLLVSDREECVRGEQVQLDVVAWDTLSSIANPADYDAWILNAS